MPEGAVKSTSYPINKPMSDLKNAVSSQCGQPTSSILFLYDGKQYNMRIEMDRNSTTRKIKVKFDILSEGPLSTSDSRRSTFARNVEVLLVFFRQLSPSPSQFLVFLVLYIPTLAQIVQATQYQC
jgi:hypothetical protein